MKNLKKQTFILLLVTLLVLYLVLKDNFSQIMELLLSMKLGYLLLAVIFIFLYWVFKSIAMYIVARHYSKSIKGFNIFKQIVITQFFNGITPFSTGGQPMQIYYMKKDDIDISHSTFALLVQLSGYQFSVVLIALISLIFSFNYVRSLDAIIVFLFIVGFIINFTLFVLYTLLIFKNSFVKKISNFCIKLLRKINLKNINKIVDKINEILKIFHESSNYIKENKMVVIKSFVTCIIQVLINYIGPYLIYKSFGFSENSLWLFISMQAILFICVSFVPIPGSVGASEAGFLGVYQFLFPASYLSSAMLLSRGISFYLFVLITGIVVIVSHYKIIKNKK